MEEEIKLPEFDREEFMKKEKRKAKTAFISFLFGFFMALICNFIWRNLDSSMRWPICFLFALASIGFMAKILQLLKIDVKDFSRKEWFGSIAFYFFTWLAVFILSINPPFYDASPPKIDAIMLPEIQQSNGNISVLAHITDNAGIKDVKIIIDGKEYDMAKDENNIYIYNYSGGNANYEIVATDINGHTARYNNSFRFSNDLIKVIIPEGKLNASDEIIIRVYKNISKEKFRVFYTINGQEVNATESGESGDYYIYVTSPQYEGWKENYKNEIKVYAEVIYYFPGINKPYKNLVCGGNYTVKTTADASIGSQPSPAIKDLPRPRSLRTPAFEFIAVIAALSLIIFIKRRKKFG